ncbi:cell division protein FtsB [Methylophaga sp. OBS1]|jgi:cell division protein FtsB|uniref:cell division protein FtsB n=1 Tax=Methylophaga sp. OBS1 TaxID=2991933 RepID=UPI0019C0D773|nr:cell division protein FtsB [Methylophaga sp. OBS1]MBD3634145.1 cell division protein FtsB [Methylophaga sp.]MCX4190936.1 cell division protein FtsB [Methylophaga sp. OBS1]MCX4192118.1 cell division protein FtsB [Methylophaga sp. OBS1]
MTKPVMIFLAILLVLLQYRLWLSHDGLPSLLRLHHQVEKQRLDNEKLTERNQVLAAEVQDLKSGLDALEERARSELGMIREGETFFHVIEEQDEQK